MDAVTVYAWEILCVTEPLRIVVVCERGAAMVKYTPENGIYANRYAFDHDLQDALERASEWTNTYSEERPDSFAGCDPISFQTTRDVLERAFPDDQTDVSDAQLRELYDEYLSAVQNDQYVPL